MRQTIHRCLYLLSLLLLVVGLTTSHFLMSLSWVMLGVNWIAEGRFREKFRDFRGQRLLHLYLLLFAFFIAGLLWSSNLGSGLDYLRKRLPILIVPLVVLTSRRLSRREGQALVAAYVATVLVVSVIGLVRLLTIPNLPYRDIIPFISHIRFCLNLCLCIGLLLWMGWRARRGGGRLRPWHTLAPALYCLVYLALLQSYTGLAVLWVVALATLVVYRRQLPKRLWAIALAALLAFTAGGFALVSSHVHSYFAPSPLASQPREALTPSGHPYLHREDSLIECGNYVNCYLCDEELRAEWPKRSALPIDSATASGYSAYSTLVRYLNATTGRKDSASLAALGEADIRAIEQGVANPYYLRKISLRRMCYMMCFEYECGRRYGAVVDFSVLQRLELWRAAWRVFLDHPAFGTGTGDYIDLLHDKLAEMDSPLKGTSWRTHAHSQYLTFLVMFGAVGFLLLAAAFILTLRRLPCRAFYPYLLTTVILLVSMLTENTLDTIGGYMMCAFLPPFFFSLFAENQATCSSSTPCPTASE